MFMIMLIIIINHHKDSYNKYLYCYDLSNDTTKDNCIDNYHNQNDNPDINR